MFLNVIFQGARRVEQRWDPSQNGQIVPDDKRVGRKLADDAMFKVSRGLDELINDDNVFDHFRLSIRSQTWTSRGTLIPGFTNCLKFK